MGLWDMIAFIVVIGCVTGVVSDWLKTKRTQMSSTSAEELEDALDRIDELEERIRTLETIVTDGKQDLSRQIDAL